MKATGFEHGDLARTVLKASRTALGRLALATASSSLLLLLDRGGLLGLLRGRFLILDVVSAQGIVLARLAGRGGELLFDRRPRVASVLWSAHAGALGDGGPVGDLGIGQLC